MNFDNFSCLIFWAQDISISPGLKISQGANVSIPQSCILLNFDQYLKSGLDERERFKLKKCNQKNIKQIMTLENKDKSSIQKLKTKQIEPKILGFIFFIKLFIKFGYFTSWWKFEFCLPDFTVYLTLYFEFINFHEKSECNN